MHWNALCVDTCNGGTSGIILRCPTRVCPVTAFLHVAPPTRSPLAATSEGSARSRGRFRPHRGTGSERHHHVCRSVSGRASWDRSRIRVEMSLGSRIRVPGYKHHLPIGSCRSSCRSSCFRFWKHMKKTEQQCSIFLLRCASGMLMRRCRVLPCVCSPRYGRVILQQTLAKLDPQDWLTMCGVVVWSRGEAGGGGGRN